MHLLLAFVSSIYAFIILLSIILTTFDLHIGFTKNYLAFITAVLKYGKQRIIAKKQSSQKLFSLEKQANSTNNDNYIDEIQCKRKARGERERKTNLVRCNQNCSSSTLAEEESNNNCNQNNALPTSNTKRIVKNATSCQQYERPLVVTNNNNISNNNNSNNNDKDDEDESKCLKLKVNFNFNQNACRKSLNTSKSVAQLTNLAPPDVYGQTNTTTTTDECKIENETLLYRRSNLRLSLSSRLNERNNLNSITATESTKSKSNSYFPSSPDEPPIFLLGDSFQNCSQTKHEFNLEDPCELISKAIDAIVDDQVIKRFYSKPLNSWNLLTRTNIRNYQFVSFRVGLIWLLGCFIRYIVLMPIRVLFALVGVSWLIIIGPFIGCLPEPMKSKLYGLVCTISFRMISKGITATIDFHNTQFRPGRGDICVANHTSPIDVLMLSCDNCYALVGQRHGGLLGMLERILSRAAKHVWFDRSEVKDRALVLEKLKEHVRGGTPSCSSIFNITNYNKNDTHQRNNKLPDTKLTKVDNNQCDDQTSEQATNDKQILKNLPILIFPEGTCVNNSAVMMFKKGSFEASERICPIAIRYDLRYGDPFWNSSEQGYLLYLLMLMSSWAIVCDVWYLPPMVRFAEETSTEFANRVKHEIAIKSGLDELSWDGQLKRVKAKVEWKFKQQEAFAKLFKID